ncbi:hypothetical protein [Cryobacterium sp. Sr8]|uniref:hypothetical protein n=1 Tax=Cryobacterium sp. Sr8 TaxID=1259203 RepID=UPI001F540266|nr:hypothetical protein [Cryobacterium sp. Sr8]
MNNLAVSIRRTVAADWREIRDLRLEMIRDSPSAYNETLDGALGNDEAEWRMRGERGTADHGIAVAAIDSAGRLVGAMAGFVSEPYERRGFTATGEAVPYNLDPGRNELEMVKVLEHE